MSRLRNYGRWQNQHAPRYNETRNTVARIGGNMNAGFFDNVAALIEQARQFVGRTANLTMCVTYFEVGRMIVEEEQGGEERAKYGRRLLDELSVYLNSRVGKGYSVATLRNIRQFYQTYQLRIQQTMFSELQPRKQSEKQQTLFSVLTGTALSQKGQATLFESYPFALSWSHYLVLMRIKDEQERRFYEIEATKHQWNVHFVQQQSCSTLG